MKNFDNSVTIMSKNEKCHGQFIIETSNVISDIDLLCFMPNDK